MPTHPVRLTSSADVALAVPLMLGYWPGPSLSVVAVAHDHTVVLLARWDIETEDTPLPDLRAALRDTRAVGVYLTVTDAPAAIRSQEWLRVAEEMGLQSFTLLDAMCVYSHGDHLLWASLNEAISDGPRLAEISSADIASRAALWELPPWVATREDYIRDIQSRPESVAAVVQALRAYGAVNEQSRDASICLVLDWIVSREEVTPEMVAQVCVALRDLRVRDTVLWELLREVRDDWSGLADRLAVVVAWAPDGALAPACTVLAILRWQCGDGSRAWAAVERALAAEPDYSLATLVSRCLATGMHPGMWRDGLAELTREECRRSA